MSKSSLASRSDEAMDVSPATVASSDFFSRPSSCARLGSLQTFGSARSASSSVRRFCLVSKSKIPPQLFRPGIQIGERRGELVDAFGFHEGCASKRAL
jgi:hypothetical protein